MRALRDEHGSDFIVLLLMVGSVIVAGGVYGDLAGPLGRWIRTGLGSTIGFIRFFTPPALLALGISMIGFPERVSDNTRSINGFKIVFGSGLALVGASGLAHLAGGQPEWGDTYESFASAGGLLGAAFAWPLASIMGSIVAGCVLAAITLFAVVVVSRSSVKGFFAALGWVLIKAGQGCAYVWRAGWRERNDERGGYGRVQAARDGAGLVGDDAGFGDGTGGAGFDDAGSAGSGNGAVRPRDLPVVSTYEMASGAGFGSDAGMTNGAGSANGAGLASGAGFGSGASGEIYDYAQDPGLSFAPCSSLDEGSDSGTSAPGNSDTSAPGNADTSTSATTRRSKKAARKRGKAAEAGGASDSKTNPDDLDAPPDLMSVDTASRAGASAGASVRSRPTTTWTLPPADLLSLSATIDMDEVHAKERGRLLEQSLEAHGVATRLVGMVIGPTVTRYELELGEGVKVSRLTSLNKDIAYAMASPDVRILAPIPGRRAIGVEVPNLNRQTVLVGDILNSPDAKKAKHPLDVAVGRDITGRSIMMNLARMPHLLIAGATGAGKSSCVNSMLTSILMRTTPEDVRLILVDPKMVEMRQFEQVPHLLTEPVIDPKKAANALNWAAKEMDRRYELLSTAGFRDIAGYNEAYASGAFGDDEEFPRLPFILVVVDELSDLMMVAARDVEDAICRIAQKARAVGIHLVVATQRPSADILTGVIKANIPARLAFSVSSLIDSRVILDQPGAERLVGQGDMLLLGPSSSAPRRIQGAWVTEAEIQKVVGFWRRQVADKGPEYVSEVGSKEIVAHVASGGDGVGDDDDDLLAEAMELVVNSGLGSTSMLQRKLRIGFARAGRLMDLLETNGVVGPSEGSKAREVYMTSAELAMARAEVEAA